MIDLPVLHTKRCLLNRITEEDILVMRHIFDDRLTRRYLAELRPLVRTDEGIRKILSSFDSFLKKNEGMMWGVRLGDTLIGFVALMDLSYNPTIIYAMHPCYRMKGYMKECVSRIVHYIFEKALCNYLRTEVCHGNKVSIYLLQSVGFKVEKQDKRKAYLRIDGRNVHFAG